jgi:hypothetical protein
LRTYLAPQGLPWRAWIDAQNKEEPVARINFEDDIEAQEEFWALLPHCDNNRDIAIGRLVRFFRIAQGAYGHNEPMTEDELRLKGLECMISSGWAVPVLGGYQALGAEKHFSWYRQRVASGEKRAKSERDEGGKFTSGRPAVASDRPAVNQPLTLSPSLSLSPSQNKKEIQGADMKKCFETWKETLRWAGSPRELTEGEKQSIVRAIQREGAENVETALYGVRHQPPIEGYNPKAFVRIDRVLEKDKNGVCKFGDYLNWGIAARMRKTPSPQVAAAVEPPSGDAVEPSEEVKEMLRKSGFGSLVKGFP